MTRPVYERQHDRDREAEVARQIAHRWEAKCLIMPKFSAADMLIIDHNDKPQCWAEIKSRNITFGTYEHMHIALEKVLRLQQLTRLTKLKAIIIANLKDGMFWHHCPETEEDIVRDIGGRTDRSDAKDIESMACLYWHHFKRIG
jgi:hypothetical protein